MRKIISFSVLFMLFCQVFAQDGPPANMPDFKFYALDGKPITKSNLQPNKTTFVFFFSPDCEHCQQEAEWIKADIAKFKNAQFLFITWEENSTMVRNFQKKYFGNISSPQMIFTQDKDYNIDNYFGDSVAPCTYVYDSHNKFIKAFRKEAPASELYNLIR